MPSLVPVVLAAGVCVFPAAESDFFMQLIAVDAGQIAQSRMVYVKTRHWQPCEATVLLVIFLRLPDQ